MSVFRLRAARTVTMAPECYLLDTSALLTLIEDEAGSDRVEHLLTHAQVLLLYPVLPIIRQFAFAGPSRKSQTWNEPMPDHNARWSKLVTPLCSLRKA